MSSLSHLDQEGRVRMVDVSDKQSTDRIATAQGKVIMQPETLAMIQNNALKKGNVLETARIAGIMAAKQTSQIIPMCHPLALNHVVVDFSYDTSHTAVLTIEASARVKGPTGVEMEALTAVSVAALTVYDMCKAADKTMMITDIVLLTKTGGKSGTFKRETR